MMFVPAVREEEVGSHLPIKLGILSAFLGAFAW